MTDMVFSINRFGATEGLHFDQFDLGFLGDKRVHRASEIIFNEQEQHWEVWLPLAPTPSAIGFQGYDEAREFEVLWLQECRRRGIEPYEGEGQDIADAMCS